MTGRTIPVTRTDDSEVAGEATQELIKAKTDNLDIALSALRDALRGTGNKTLTDLWDELASTLAVSDSTSHTTLASILTALSPLATDAKLEAVRALLAGTLNVSGPLTDTQLRAAAVAISAASLPLPSGAATSANQTTANTSLSGIDGGIGGASAAAAGDTGASTTNGFLRWMRDFWFALKGTKTAANSVSVTGASDGVFYVGGVSADGVAPTNQAVRVSGIDGSGLKRTLATDSSGYQYVKQLPTLSAAINLNTAGQSVQLAVADGYNSWSITLDTASLTGAVFSFQFTKDSGSSWYPCLMQSQNTSTPPVSGVSSAGATFEGPIPNGATHVRFYISTLTSGTVVGTVRASPRVMSPALQSSVFIAQGLPVGNNRLGFIAGSGVWYDDTSTALTASSTFTSTARDVTANNAGNTFSSAGTYAKEYRVMVEQDVTFTLQIHASRDNSTFRIVESITAASVPGGGFVASASIAPAWRYYRYAIVNGGTSAARTTGGSIVMAI